ncbi:MAG: hypothetical protein CME32_10570 [Gimesia sp.]|nr:hypothetical protein [Gimesia sp.]
MTSPSNVTVAITLAVVLLSLFIFFWIRFILSDELPDNFATVMARTERMLPLLRIDLEPLDEAPWADSNRINMIANTLRELGYEPDGIFEVKAHIPFIIQGFKNQQRSSFAGLYELKQSDYPILDLVADSSEGTCITISNERDKGLDTPPFLKLTRLEHLDLSDPEHIREMHARLCEELKGETTVDLKDTHFDEHYKSFWANYTDWRMERGGLTTEEVIRMAQKNGEPEPSEEEIELAQNPWKQRIDLFLLNQLWQEYCNNTNMTDEEWLELFDRMVIVHEHSEANLLIETLADSIYNSSDLNHVEDDEEEHPYFKVLRQLNELFDSEESVMDAFHRALELLPPDQKYMLQSTKETPCKSEIYLIPKPHNV